MARGTSLKWLARSERPAAFGPSARRLLRYLLPHRRALAGAFVWQIVSATNLAVAPAVTGWLIDTALEAAAGPGDPSVLWVPAIALVASAFVGWQAQRAQILAVGILGQRALYALRNDIFSAVQRLPVAFVDRVGSGELMSRLVNDVETVNAFLSQGFRRAVAASLGIATTLAGMLLVDARLALATLGVVPVMLGVTRLFGSVARRAFRRRQETIGDVSSMLAEEIAGIRVAQAYVRTDHNLNAFGERNASNRDAGIAAAAVSSAFAPTLGVITAGATALVAGYGGWLAATGEITVGVVVAFFAYARSFFNGVTQLSSLYAETQSALAGSERIFALQDEPAEVPVRADAIDPGRLSGSVRFENVSFRYGDGPLVLENVDLEVAPGETVAVVGPTGAGKSTLVGLLLRFHDPTAGRVLLDGHDARDLDLPALRRNMGVVLQDPFLFPGSIAENIRYGRLDATDAEVRTAAGRAQALPFIDRLAEGMETRIGERGAALSGGQRQLLAYARALLVDPAVLVLDEATASVDTRTERAIQEGLREVLRDRTAFVIAHRLSTVRDADRVIVLERGAVTEQGTYEELLARGGLFARLHAAQFAAD